MALAVTNRASAGDTSNATSYVSASFTPTANALLVACFSATRGSSTDPDLPTLSGGSLTWTQVADFKWVSSGTTRARMTIFAAQASGSPSAMTVTASYSGANTGAAWTIFEVTGSDVANSTPLQCLTVQTPVTTTANATGTSMSLTLAAGSAGANRAFLFAAHAANEVYTGAANWAEIGAGGYSSPSAALDSQWRSDAFTTSVSTSWTTSTNYGGIALEIKAALLTASPAGALSFGSGSITRQTGHALAGGLALGATAARSALKSLSAALSFASGAITRSAGKALAGTLSFASGAITRSAGKALAGTLASAGAISRAITRSISGGLALSGSPAKQLARAFGGGLSFASGALDAAGRFARSLSGALAFTSGAITRSAGKPLAGTLASAGAISRSLTRSLAAGLALAGSMAKQLARPLQSVLSFGGTATRSILKPIAGALTFASGVLGRAGLFARSLAGTLTLAGAISASRVFLQAIAGALSFSGEIARQLSRSLSGTLTFAGANVRRSARALLASLSLGGSIGRATSRPIAAVLSFGGDFAKVAGKALTGAIAFTGHIPQLFQQLIEATLGFFGFGGRIGTLVLDGVTRVSLITDAVIEQALGLNGVSTVSLRLCRET